MPTCKKCSPIINNPQIDSCSITEDQYLCQFLKLFRIGPIWECMIGSCCEEHENKSKFRHLIDAIGKQLFKNHKMVCDLALESNPCTAQCESSLLDWAKVYGIDHCLDDLDLSFDELKDLICKFHSHDGGFNGEWIKCLGEIEGYTILNCETDKSMKTITVETNNCGTGFGYFQSNPGSLVSEFNTECQRRYSDFPCANCCGEVVDNSPEDNNENDCNQIQRILGTCADCGNECAGFPPQPIIETKEVLCNPSTITLTIEGPPPCLEPMNFGKNFGRPFSTEDNDFKLCLLESQTPAHICVRYEFTEEC